MAQKPWTQVGTTESILYRKHFHPLHLHTSADDMALMQLCGWNSKTRERQGNEARFGNLL